MGKAVRFIVSLFIGVLLCASLLLGAAVLPAAAGGPASGYASKPMWEALVLEKRTASFQSPKDPEAFFWLGIGLANVGKIKEAASAFEKMLQLDTDKAAAGRLQNAAARTLARDPHNLPANNALAFLEYSAGSYVAAADTFATVVSLDPDNPWSRCYYGYSLGKAGRIDAAVAMLEESVRRFPENQQLRFLLGLGYYHKGAFFKAVKEMAKARDAIMDF